MHKIKKFANFQNRPQTLKHNYKEVVMETMKDTLEGIRDLLETFRPEIVNWSGKKEVKGKTKLVVQIVSDDFEDLSRVTRVALVKRVLNKKGSPLNQWLDLSFECLTTREYQLFKTRVRFASYLLLV